MLWGPVIFACPCREMVYGVMECTLNYMQTNCLFRTRQGVFLIGLRGIECWLVFFWMSRGNVSVVGVCMFFSTNTQDGCADVSQCQCFIFCKFVVSTSFSLSLLRRFSTLHSVLNLRKRDKHPLLLPFISVTSGNNSKFLVNFNIVVTQKPYLSNTSLFSGRAQTVQFCWICILLLGKIKTVIHQFNIIFSYFSFRLHNYAFNLKLSFEQTHKLAYL